MEIILFLLGGLVLSVIGLTLIANAVETIRKALGK
jgi:hypothetical protein